MICHEVHMKNRASIWNPNDKTCTCIYCKGDNRMHYGLNIPKNWKAHNSWYVVKYWPHRYVRATGIGPILAKMLGKS